MSEPVNSTTPGGDSSDRGRSRPARVAPFVALAVIAVLVGLFWVLADADGGDSGESADSPLIGRPAPAVVSTTFDDAPFDLARRRGSWVVLNFFNSTCVPCIREHPELVAFAEQQAARGTDGAELYTIVFDDDDAPVRDFFEDNGGGWPIVRDRDGTIATSFGMSQVPETWIVAPSGVVAGRFIGEITSTLLDTTIADLKEQTG